MTPGFFNLYKPRKWDHRFIYYDPKKEAQKEREKRLAKGENVSESEFRTTIHRGSFRDAVEQNKNSRKHQSSQSNIRLIIIIFILVALVYFFLK